MAAMKAPSEGSLVPPSKTKWAPGAEPLAICMSCNSTYPVTTTECSNCQVGLSIVRKCPACGRTQAAQHITCIYCADSFIQEDGLAPLEAGPLIRRQKLAEQRLRIIAGVSVAVGIAAIVALFLTRNTWRTAPPVMGQTYVLAEISMRSEPSTNSPPVADVHPPQILGITNYTIDGMGNRWFQVTKDDVHGYVLTQEVAPPKSTNPEKGFEILRHSLLGLDNPGILEVANDAVEHYRNSFPASIHTDELRWLLADRTRVIAESSGHPRELLSKARKQYEQLAQGRGEYAERARLALGELPESAPAPRGDGKRIVPPLPSLGFSVQGGSENVSRPSGPTQVDAPTRSVTEVSRTPLLVRVTRSVDVSPGAVFQGEFVQDIRVNNEVAIPRGSRATMRIEAGEEARSLSAVRITAATINGETYRVSATATRIEAPGKGRTPQTLGAVIPPGARLEFQLDTPLVIRQR